MARKFNVPVFFRASGIAAIKQARLKQDPKRKDLSPSLLDFGPVRFKVARHFGFCFGVENAIEIAYRAVEENPGKRIFLLSEMIHNPQVNADLLKRGVRFLMSTDGTRMIDFSELQPADIVIVPAFGTTVELQNELTSHGIDPYYYDTTCPFVEKVWRRAEELGKKGYAIIVHGKRTHEETRATFSHSKQTAPTLVVLNMEEAEKVSQFMKGELSRVEFDQLFSQSMSSDFEPEVHLKRIGVVNQTTMLATETAAIAKHFRDTLESLYGKEALKNHFADTRDTLCYATHENQSATRALIDDGADLAIVVGGYNSSNTSHLVELLAEHMPCFYIKDAGEIINDAEIRSFDLKTKAVELASGWLPGNRPLTVAITSGASCPDSTVDAVITKVVSLFSETEKPEVAYAPYAA